MLAWFPEVYTLALFILYSLFAKQAYKQCASQVIIASLYIFSLIKKISTISYPEKFRKCSSLLLLNYILWYQISIINTDLSIENSIVIWWLYIHFVFLCFLSYSLLHSLCVSVSVFSALTFCIFFFFTSLLSLFLSLSLSLPTCLAYLYNLSLF